jgi:hypothetical protein
MMGYLLRVGIQSFIKKTHGKLISSEKDRIGIMSLGG